MKRYGNLYKQICSLDNLHLADAIAQMGKAKQHGVQRHIINAEANIAKLHELLVAGEYKTSPYTTFKIYEPKERLVFRLPYYPDRIVHHAIMNVLRPIFVATFTKDTYSCIEGRGVHAAARAVKQALKDVPGTQYCLKLDIKKFYPSINHDTLKTLLRKKIKDRDLLSLLDGIIDSAEGVPIGNYLSQYFANYYLTWFDHWIKEQMQVHHYFRYADDIVILSDCKQHLHQLLSRIRQYLADNLQLQVKDNYQVFPVLSRGIDFVGYRFYHTHTALRKSIKQAFARAMASGKSEASIASYTGWAMHCNSINLIKTLSNEKFLRIQHKEHRNRIHWRQDQNRTTTESTDHCNGIPGGEQQIQRPGMPVPSNRTERNQPRCIHRQFQPDQYDQPGTKRRVSVPNNHNKGLRKVSVHVENDKETC